MFTKSIANILFGVVMDYLNVFAFPLLGEHN